MCLVGGEVELLEDWGLAGLVKVEVEWKVDSLDEL